MDERRRLGSAFSLRGFHDTLLRNGSPPTSFHPRLLDAAAAGADWALADPGYTLAGMTNSDIHPTIAQKLIYDLVLFDEPPSLRRALRERIVAAQITEQYGRTQILEWYLNSANFGRHVFGVEAAAQLYFGKPAAQSTTAESAILAAVSEAPSLNPHDAPQAALERGIEILNLMHLRKLLSDEATANALGESPTFRTTPPAQPQVAAAFVNLLLSQLDSQFPRERIERGGLTIFSTLDYDLQKQSSCVTAFYAARLAGLPDPAIQCDGRFSSSRPCRLVRRCPTHPPARSSPTRMREMRPVRSRPAWVQVLPASVER